MTREEAIKELTEVPGDNLLTCTIRAAISTGKEDDLLAFFSEQLRNAKGDLLKTTLSPKLLNFLKCHT